MDTLGVRCEEFESKKVGNKLVQQVSKMRDCFVV